MNNKILGDIGENLALNYLKKNKIQIITKNFKTKIGEIDIIAKDGEYIVFVEVKNRTSRLFGLPRESVTLKKQHTIRNVALIYMKNNGLLNTNVRFDVIEVEGGNITHLKNCF